MVILCSLGDGRTELRFLIARSSVDCVASVVGDFNNWQPGATPLVADGEEWSATAVCDAGRYEYRILCDGCGWMDDWSATEWSEGPHGVWNAVVVVDATVDADAPFDIDLREETLDEQHDRVIDVRGPAVVATG